MQALRSLRTTSRRGTANSLDSTMFVNLIGAAFELDDTSRRWLSQEYTRDSDAVDSPLLAAPEPTAVSPPHASTPVGTGAASSSAPVAVVVPITDMPQPVLTLTVLGACLACIGGAMPESRVDVPKSVCVWDPLGL
jgi:hypothetical protein